MFIKHFKKLLPNFKHSSRCNLWTARRPVTISDPDIMLIFIVKLSEQKSDIFTYFYVAGCKIVTNDGILMDKGAIDIRGC